MCSFISGAKFLPVFYKYLNCPKKQLKIKDTRANFVEQFKTKEMQQKQ